MKKIPTIVEAEEAVTGYRERFFKNSIKEAKQFANALKKQYKLKDLQIIPIRNFA